MKSAPSLMPFQTALHTRFVLVAVIVTCVVAYLIYGAVIATAKPVVTVSELLNHRTSTKGVRLAARVSGKEIHYQKSPELLLEFSVKDIVSGGQELPVVYRGIMPDTLVGGRDVILEGDFLDGHFTAKTLMTQCPSKYEAGFPVNKPL